MRHILGITAVIFIFAFVFSGCGNGASSTSIDNSARPIVCLGDSITEGYGASQQGAVDKSKSYPAFLQKKVSVPVVNAGISGNTAADGLARVNSDVLSKDPQMVIILLGGNDFLPPRMRPAKETKNDLQAIINRLRNGNRKIFLASFIGDENWEESFRVYLGMIPGAMLNNLLTLFNEYKALYADLARENPDIEYIPNIWIGINNTHMSDPIHPNEEGYSRIANTIFNAIEPHLGNDNL